MTNRPEHIDRPHLRRIQPLPVHNDQNQQAVALRDPLLLCDQTMVVPPQVMAALQQCNGQHSLDEIAGAVKQDPAIVQQLIEKLDEFGLIWGPRFEELEAAKQQALQSEGAFPIRATEGLRQDDGDGRALIESWLDQEEDPEVDFTPRGLFAPHMDYVRTWPLFAGCWQGLRTMTPPDRVVVLSTNHYGIGDGVVCTRLGFETPMGRMESDSALLDPLLQAVGDQVLVDELDHIASTGIEMQLPWIQACWGNVPVVGILVPDPAQALLEDDQERIGRTEFNRHLRDCVAQVGGTTFFVGAGDLSHVGPQFGEPRPVDDQRCGDVEQQDRDLLGHIVSGDLEAFTSALQWSKNPTRWASAGVFASMLEAMEPSEVELIDYRQYVNEQKTSLVSYCGLLMA
ncbi:MAG: AmmeMemoRadiSam system protein B [Planctomycetota bacterium]|nr:AmmeMemoRadiSam system protein B [Planctomycetota bacterium]